MTHDETLRKLKQHFDDLKVRNPQMYQSEERHLAQDEQRLGMRVAMAPTHIRRAERMR